jgi:gluconolactonase
MLTGAGASAATVASTIALAQDFVPSPRQPDERIKALDPSFQKYIVFFGVVERLYAGNTAYTEGPVYFGDGRYLLWTDIPNNVILRWDEQSGQVTTFRKPSNYANGLTRDRQGRLISAEHGRRVTRTEYDGTITIIADNFEGKKFNSPNDVVVASDDSIWFTDPPFGLSLFSGERAASELPNNVYRVDKSGKITVVASDVTAPNGLCFSPDEKKMYIVDSFSRPVTVRAYDVTENLTRLSNSRVFFTCEPGEAPDGMRCDVDGNLWMAYGAVKPGVDGVLVLNPEGKRIGMISLPERAANITFGGVKRNRLFIVTARGLYAVYVNTQGVKGS